MQVVVLIRRPAGPPRRTPRPARSRNGGPEAGGDPPRSASRRDDPGPAREAPERTRPSASSPASSLLTRCRSCSSCRSFRSSRSRRNLMARRSSTVSRAAASTVRENVLPFGLRVASLETRPARFRARRIRVDRMRWLEGPLASSQPTPPSVSELRSIIPSPVGDRGSRRPLEVLGLHRAAGAAPGDRRPVRAPRLRRAAAARSAYRSPMMVGRAMQPPEQVPEHASRTTGSTRGQPSRPRLPEVLEGPRRSGAGVPSVRGGGRLLGAPAHGRPSNVPSGVLAGRPGSPPPSRRRTARRDAGVVT